MISTVLNAITATLKTLAPDASVFIGAEYIADQTAIAPRIVWVPTTGSPEGAAARVVTFPRSLGTRVTRLEAHLWGKGNGDPGSDFDACETLLQQLVQAMRATLSAGYAYEGDVWPDQDGASVTQYGRELIARFAIPTPLPDETITTTLVAPVAETQTGEMYFADGTNVSGTPAP